MLNAFRNGTQWLNPIDLVRYSVVSAEGRWFDWRYNVQTQVDPSEKLQGWSYSYPYLPIRPRSARRALRSLPIERYSDYTLVDIGSGKGRILLIASEFPFRKIIGVELRRDLHDQALENVQRYRHRNKKCFQIECQLEDATRYQFPAGKLVVYMFNPFSSEVMGQVLRRLDESAEKNPRDVVLVYAYPEFGSQMRSMRNFRMIEETRSHLVARSHHGRAL